jgi:hypothetical protein
LLEVSERRQISRIAIVASVATLLVFGNLARAQLTGDDWHYFALLRHIDSPVEIFTTNIAGAYFYRPLALYFFWVSEALFGSNPVAHYGINVALHGWVAFEVVALATTITKARVASAWAGALFLLLPATSGTALWVSDRFDLLATAAMLCALRLMMGWTRALTPQKSTQFGSLAMTLLALGSKETAFAVIPALLLVLLGSNLRSNHSRWITGGAVMVIAALAVYCRVAALSGWKGDQSLPLTASVIASGAAVWLANLPVALQTHHGHFALVGLGVAALAALLGSRAVRSASRPFSFITSIAPLLILLVGVVLAQSPVALIALPKNGGELPTVSLRFFYTPFALLAVLAVVCFSCLAFNRIWLMWALRLSVLSAIVIATLGSVAQSEFWAKNTSAETQQAAVPLAEYASLATRNQLGSPCLVRMPSAPHLTDLDLRFKASLATSDARINCALLTQPSQAQTITRIRNCRSASVLPARSTIAGLEPWARSGTCTFFFLSE